MVDSTHNSALLRVVKAAISLRNKNMTRATGTAVYAYRELWEAVDALALSGAVLELERLTESAGKTDGPK